MFSRAWLSKYSRSPSTCDRSRGGAMIRVQVARLLLPVPLGCTLLYPPTRGSCVCGVHHSSILSQARYVELAGERIRSADGDGRAMRRNGAAGSCCGMQEPGVSALCPELGYLSPSPGRPGRAESCIPCLGHDTLAALLVAGRLVARSCIVWWCCAGQETEAAMLSRRDVQPEAAMFRMAAT